MPPLPTVARPKRITWGCSAAKAAPNQLALRAATMGSSSLRFMGDFLFPSMGAGRIADRRRGGYRKGGCRCYANLFSVF
ncbi:hypothetical protein D3C85_1676490 [compost metagenome]